MLTIDNKKTKISVGDILFFHKYSNTVSFVRGGIKMYFDFSKTVADKKSAIFIESKEDFCSFASFIGNILCLSGKLIDENNGNFSWQFTHHKRGNKGACKETTIVTFHIEIKHISFTTGELKLQFSASFLKNETDFEEFLLILGSIFNCRQKKEDDIVPNIVFKRTLYE